MSTTLSLRLLPWLACMGLGLGAMPIARGQSQVDLREYLDAVAASNVQLQAQREAVTGAQAGVSVAGVRPDPLLNGGIASKELSSANKPSAATATTLGVSFTIETGGKRDARVRAARSNVRLTQVNVASFERQLEADASTAFIEACRTEATLLRQEASLAAMRDIVRANEVRFKAGDIGKLELSQSRVEAERFQADVITARAQAMAAKLSLGTFLGERPEQRFAGRTLACEWHEQPLPEVDTLVQQALQARDDVQQARVFVDNARDNVELARANRSVDPTVNVGLTNTPRIPPVVDGAGSITNSPAERSLALSVTLSVPIPLSRMQRGELTQAESALTQAQLQLRDTLLKAEADVRVAHTQLEAASANVRAYTERVLDDSQRVLEGMRTSYRKGAASLLDLLNAQRGADEVYAAYLQAMADRANASVKLQKSVGEPARL